LSFENGLKTDRGEEPIIADGPMIVAGKEGRAGMLLKGAVLAYPTAGNYDPKRGTLDLWIRPNWDSIQPSNDRFFWGVDSDPGTGNRAVLGFLSRNDKGVVYFGGDGALGGLSAPVDWRPGEWHHLVVWWNQERHCRALYIDGARRHAIEYGAGCPTNNDTASVSSGAVSSGGCVSASRSLDLAGDREQIVWNRVGTGQSVSAARRLPGYPQTSQRLSTNRRE